MRSCWTKEPNNLMENTHRWSKELRCWVCPASPVPPSCPSLTPGGDRRVTHLQCHHLPCRRIIQAPTVLPAIEWLLQLLLACLNCRHSPAECPFTGVELWWWCLWWRCHAWWSARAGSLLAWEEALKVGRCPMWASVQLSKCYLFTLSGCRVSLHFHFRLSLQLTHNVLADVLSQGIFWRQREQYQRTGAPAQFQQYSALLGMAWPFFWTFFTTHTAWMGGRKCGCPVVIHRASCVSEFHIFLISLTPLMKTQNLLNQSRLKCNSLGKTHYCLNITLSVLVSMWCLLPKLFCLCVYFENARSRISFPLPIFHHICTKIHMGEMQIQQQQSDAGG